MMMLPSMYAFECACNGRGYQGEKARGRYWEMVLSAVAICFVVFMLYGAGLKYVLLAAVVWAIGLPLFIIGKREQRQKLTPIEWTVRLAVIVMAAAALLGIWTGHLAL